MRGYPVILTHLETRRCVIIGGGAVAARKAQALVDAGAHPVIVSPDLCSELAAMVHAGEATAVHRKYQPGDLDGAALVIAATDDEGVNRAVAEECRRSGILVNVVDRPALCTFVAPSVIRRDDLLVAISTCGGSPAFAKRVREILESFLDSTYGDALALFTELRLRIRQNVPASRQRELWDRLLDGEVLACLRSQGVVAARALAERIVHEFSADPMSDNNAGAS